MKFLLTVVSLLIGVSEATTVQMQRRADDALEARVKAIEDFLAVADSSCVVACNKDIQPCLDACATEDAGPGYDSAV